MLRELAARVQLGLGGRTAERRYPYRRTVYYRIIFGIAQGQYGRFRRNRRSDRRC